MENEHAFALLRDSTGAGNTDDPACDGSTNGADERIRTALAELSEVFFGPMSRTAANGTLGLLSRLQSMTSFLICDVGSRVADSDPDIDLAEVLRQGARLPSWSPTS